MEAPADALAPISDAADAPGRRHHLAWSAAILVAFGLTVAGLASLGSRGRVIAPAPTSVAVEAPQQAFLRWKSAGLRGRTLLLFDGYPHYHTDWQAFAAGARLDESNWLEFAVFENLVRRVAWIVPDENWDAFRRQPALYRPIREAPRQPAATPLYTGSGLLLDAVTPSTLPSFEEPVLVYVNGARFDPRQVEALLARRAIRFDSLVVRRGAAVP